MRKRILFPLLILGMVMILAAGCTESSGPADNTTPTAIPQTIAAEENVTTDLTQAGALNGTNVTPAPTLSAACSDLLPASGADQAFLDFVNDNKIVNKVTSLGTEDCSKQTADYLYQQVMTSAIPQTSGLAQGRRYLISATTYCQEPNMSAPKATLSDLAKFEEKHDEYLDMLYSCHIEISVNASGVAGGERLDMRNLEGAQSFSGTGNSVRKFTATQGDFKYTVTYSGFGNYSTYITNVYGKTIATPFHVAGPYSGSAVVTFPANGEYYMTIEASGPYLMKMIQA